MADAYGALSDLLDDIRVMRGVESARLELVGEHVLEVHVELAQYDADVWDRIVIHVDDIARAHVDTASVDLDIHVLSSASQ